MDILYKVGSIVLLLVGGLYPLAAIYMMMKFLARTDAPRPSPAFMMLHFVLMATVPLAGILGGTAGFAPTLWESQVIRVIVYGAGVLSLVAFVMLFVSMRAREPDRGE
jgi:hypothetical protein